MKKASLLLLAVLLMGIASNQAITRGYIFSGIGSTFVWSGAAQSGWNSSTQVATCADFTTYIQNDGTACSPSTQVLTYGFATAHAVVSTLHTFPANGSFSGPSFASWTSANTGACNGQLFQASSGSDVDGDGGIAFASSLACVSSSAVITLSQNFNTTGLPTNQTYSFAYKGTQVSAGDPTNCTQGFGTVSLVLNVSGTNVATIASPILDGQWHTVSGTLSLMINGGNSITLTATLKGASGSNSVWNQRLQDYTCKPATSGAQTISVDDFVLQGNY